MLKEGQFIAVLLRSGVLHWRAPSERAETILYDTMVRVHAALSQMADVTTLLLSISPSSLAYVETLQVALADYCYRVGRTRRGAKPPPVPLSMFISPRSS